MNSTKLVLAAAAASCLFAQPALAEDLIFMLDNRSSADVTEFYASPVGVSSWEEDILGTDILPSGEAIRITIGDSREVCEYDLRIVFADGDVVEDAGVDLCDTGSYSLED